MSALNGSPLGPKQVFEGGVVVKHLKGRVSMELDVVAVPLTESALKQLHRLLALAEDGGDGGAPVGMTPMKEWVGGSLELSVDLPRSVAILPSRRQAPQVTL